MKQLAIVPLPFAARCRRLASAALPIAVAALCTASARAQAPGFEGRLIDLTPQVTTAAQAYNLATNLGANSLPGQIQTDVTDIVAAADLRGTGDGAFVANLPYPGGVVTPGNGTDFVVTLQSNVTIPTGTWQITFGSDDGGWLQLPGVSFTEQFNENGNSEVVGLNPGETLWFNAPRGQTWTSGVFTVDDAQGLNTTLFHGFFERGGGDLTEIAIRDASGGSVDTGAGLDVAADNWTLLEEGALGWSLETDAAFRRDIGGRDVIGREILPITLEPTDVERLGEPVEGLFMRVFNGFNLNNVEVWNGFLSNLPPADGQGIVPWINWDESGSTDDNFVGYSDAQPILDAIDPTADPFTSNFSNYSAQLTGEILVPQSGEIMFKDGNDDYAYFAVDVDGDGAIQRDEILIDDNGAVPWTGAGSPIVTANFENVEANGSWRRMEFRFAEGGGDDNAALFWDQNVAGLFPATPADPATENELVPPENFRTFQEVILSADLVGSFETGVFEVRVSQLDWDRLAMGGSTAEHIESVRLNLEGAEFQVEIEDPENLVSGFTIDLISDENIDEIAGMPSVTFLNTDEANWDTSMFAANGQLMFTGGAPVLTGDFNASGQVEQGDLDLVLLNWGQSAAALPIEWMSQRPMEGIVDQAELDTVLLNWGDTAAVIAAVPEPGTAVLLLTAGGLALALLRRK